MTRGITGEGSFPLLVWLQALGTPLTMVPVEQHFMPFSTSAG